MNNHFFMNKSKIGDLNLTFRKLGTKFSKKAKR